MTDTPQHKGHWDKGIWALYGAFVLFIVSLAAVAATQRFDLVESNYYEKGLAFQEQIDRSVRALQGGAPQLKYNRTSGRLTFCLGPEEASVTDGQIRFYRSSNARHDFAIAMSIDSLGCQSVTDDRLISGPWRVICEWVVDGEPRYWEDELIVP